jgi:hypothetical protein
MMDLSLAKRILGIDYRLSETELKSIYRQKAIILHPDTNKTPTAAEDFRNLNTAYQFLLKHLNALQSKPKDKPNCPIIYRTLDKNTKNCIVIPKGALKENDLCIYYIWRGNEYRTIFKKGMELPTTVKIEGIDLTLELKEEVWR